MKGAAETPVATEKGTNSPTSGLIQSHICLAEKQPEHAHAVFQLGHILVEGLLRQRQPGQKIKFVGAPGKAGYRASP